MLGLQGRGKGEIFIRATRQGFLQLELRYGRDRCTIDIGPDAAKRIAGALNQGARFEEMVLIEKAGAIVGAMK